VFVESLLKLSGNEGEGEKEKEKERGSKTSFGMARKT
jgi:hypothetical protein